MIEPALPVKSANPLRTVRPAKTDETVNPEVGLGSRAIRNLDWDLLWEKFGIATVLAFVWILAALATPRFANLSPSLPERLIYRSALLRLSALGPRSRSRPTLVSSRLSSRPSRLEGPLDCSTVL